MGGEVRRIAAGLAAVVLAGLWGCVPVSGVGGSLASPTAAVFAPTASPVVSTPSLTLAPTLTPTPTPIPTPTSVPTPTPTLTPAPDDGATPLAGLLIGLDAGHQAKGNAALEPVAPGAAEQKPKVSSGTAGRVSGVPEYKVNLAVALLLEQKLTDLGARVLMARTANEVNISNAERAVMMNEAGAALCIRLHANGSENGNVHGAMMLIPGGEGTKDIRAASRQAGEILFRHFLRATGAADAGVIERTDLTGFNWSAVPVCLIEMGFMSNAAEDALLIDPLYQEKCAQGLADGVVAWAGTLTIDD